MATVLRSYDWSYVSRSNKRPRGRAYPWDDWFDGRIWQLEQGTDFDGPPASLERVIRTSANRRGIKVRIRIEDGSTVILQQHTDEEPMRKVTRSPSLKSIRAAREATNGDKPRPTKRTTTKTVAKVSKKPVAKHPETGKPRRTMKRTKVA